MAVLIGRAIEFKPGLPLPLKVRAGTETGLIIIDLVTSNTGDALTIYFDRFIPGRLSVYWQGNRVTMPFLDLFRVWWKLFVYQFRSARFMLKEQNEQRAGQVVRLLSQVGA